MTLSEYSNLKRQVIVAFGKKDTHNNLLNTVKDIFEDDINSIRRFELIQSIGQLLQTLELRDILGEGKVQPLKKIAEAIGSHDLLEELTNYERLYVAPEHSNLYVSQKANKSKPTEQPSQSGVGNERKSRILKVVIEQIGTSWRDLARFLGVRECVIDEIEFNNRTLATKAMKMMLHYETHPLYDPQNWHHNLCDALEQIHRIDILRSVKKITMMNL